MDTRSAEQSAENTWPYTCSFNVALRIGRHVSTSKINDRFLTTQNVCGTLRQLFIITKKRGYCQSKCKLLNHTLLSGNGITGKLTQS